MLRTKKPKMKIKKLSLRCKTGYINTISLVALLFFFLISSTTEAQVKRYTISGFIREAGSMELLIGVNIYVPAIQSGTITNNYGFYSITLPEGEYELRFSYVGYQAVSNSIVLDKNIKLDLSLRLSGELEGIDVVGERITLVSEQARMSNIEVPIRQIKQIPTLLGERDVFKVIQLLPGVQKGGEGSSGLYVRGGGPDQNLIILDDAPVYNASHLFGFFSVFNGDALKSVELVKGGFPARYGGRLSSVIDMTMKDGNKEKFGGEAGIGVISSRLLLEGPLVKGKSSFIVSGRRTYIDALIRPFLNENKGIGGYYFYDLNAKVNYEIDRKNKIFVSGYFGRDKFYARIKESYFNSESRTSLYWQNSTATVRWNHLHSDKLFINTSFIYSTYNFNVESEELYMSEYYKLKYSSGIEDFSLKTDMQYNHSPNHQLRWGVSTIRHWFNPSAIVYKTNQSPDFNLKARSLTSYESGLYIEDEMKIGQRFRSNAGFRLSHFIHSDKHYIGPEPRLSVSYTLAKDIALKGSYARMFQYVHLLSPTGVGLPTDLWVPATDRIPPQESNQVALGIAKDFREKEYALTIEGYYKWMDQIISYREGASFMLIDEPGASQDIGWQNNIVSGKGWSYGTEFMIQKKTGKIQGWLGYTLSWTQHQFDELNNGEKFWARYDRRHDASIVFIYNINDEFRFSSTWVYGTGNAITLPIADYEAHQHKPFDMFNMPYEVVHYGSKNDFRMRAYHRLDIGLEFRKKNRWGEQSIDLSVYNAYFRWNPYFYMVERDYWTGRAKLRQVGLFPIIPSLSFSQKF